MMRPVHEHRGDILVVGVGDDGPAGLPPDVLKRVQRADVLFGGRRHLALFKDVAAERVPIAGGMDRLLVRLNEESNRRRRIVVLASGDPCFYGIGPLLAEMLGRARVEIVPGISAVALAFARLGIAWQDATVVSAHGRPLEKAIAAAIGAPKLAVLTDETNTPSVVAEALLRAGADNASAWVFEHLGSSREQASQSTLATLRGRSFAALNVLVVPALTWTHAEPSAPALTARPHVPCGEGRAGHFGLPEAAYAHTASLITKPEVRAISLSKLWLRPGQVLWDVGAGSGSLGIEAAGLYPGLTVYAVERSGAQIDHLQQNVSGHGAADAVQVVAGEAPDALRDLPTPHAVFVGGTGGRLAEILTCAAERVQAGGRIVLNLITYEHVAEALHWAGAAGLAAEVVQVSVARGAEIAGLTRLQAENPVTVVTLSRPTQGDSQ